MELVWALYVYSKEKILVLKSQKFPVAKGTAFSGIFRKEDATARYTQILISYREFSLSIQFHFNFVFHVSDIQQLPDFLETLLGKFQYHLSPFRIFRNFG